MNKNNNRKKALKSSYRYSRYKVMRAAALGKHQKRVLSAAHKPGETQRTKGVQPPL